MSDILKIIATELGNLASIARMKDLLLTALQSKMTITEIVEKGLRKGLEIIGQKYEAGEYFLSELLYGSEIMEVAFDIIRPYLKLSPIGSRGTIVTATVKGDLHDIGKNVFKMFAEASGYQVIDLGIDVDPLVVIDSIKKYHPDILGLSALLTTTIEEMKNTIDQIHKAKIPHTPHIILGGNAISKEYGLEIGADGVALDAVEGVKMCDQWVRK